MTPPDLNDESRAALQLMPFTKDIFDLVKAKLPPGTDFGVMVLVPGKPEGNVIAITTDRRRVAFAVGQWVASVLKDG